MGTVLVVEDEDAIIPHIQDALVVRGDAFQRARSLEKARKLFHAFNFDYVLLDLKILARENGVCPDMEYGLAFLKEIRQTKGKERIPVIAMTSHIDGFGLTTELHKLGINECVPKPFNDKQPLARIVDKVLAVHAAPQTPSAVAQHPVHRSREPIKFRGGELVFFKDRVELHTEGMPVKILGDTGDGTSRKMLDFLRPKHTNGRFVCMGGGKIAAAINHAIGGKNVGMGTITGCAKTIRDNIRERLLREVNVICEDGDVLVNNRQQGYHLNDEKITERDGVEYDMDTVVPVSQAPVIAGDSADGLAQTPMANSGKVVAVAGGETGVPEDAAGVRRRNWILGQVENGGTITRKQIEAHFEIGDKTAKRDLSELVKLKKIEFVRMPQPGFYRKRTAASGVGLSSGTNSATRR